jgi:hypothetical protein
MDSPPKKPRVGNLSIPQVIIRYGWGVEHGNTELHRALHEFYEDAVGVPDSRSVVNKLTVAATRRIQPRKEN